MARVKGPGQRIDLVDVPESARPLDMGVVRALAESIREIGLLYPILVTASLEPPHGRVDLIAGRHRLEACKLLGWRYIPAEVLVSDDLKHELASIDENLIRAELTKLQRAKAIARRKAIYVELHAPTKHGGAPGAGKGKGKKPRDRKVANSAAFQKSFISDTASKTGRSERAVRQDAQIGTGISDAEAAELTGTPAEDNQKALLDIAKEKNPTKRAQKVEQAKQPKRRKGREAKSDPAQLDALIGEQTEAGYAPHEIAKQLGCSRSRVHQAKRRLGINRKAQAQADPLRTVRSYATEYADSWEDILANPPPWGSAQWWQCSDVLEQLERLQKLTGALISILEPADNGGDEEFEPLVAARRAVGGIEVEVTAWPPEQPLDTLIGVIESKLHYLRGLNAHRKRNGASATSPPAEAEVGA